MEMGANTCHACAAPMLTQQTCSPNSGCYTAPIPSLPFCVQHIHYTLIAAMSNLPVYLVDYSMFSPPAELRVDFYRSQADAWKWKCCTKDKHDFVSKIFLASGISVTRPALPACLQPTHTEEPKTDLLNAQHEAKQVYGQVIAEVLRKTGISQSFCSVASVACTSRARQRRRIISRAVQPA
eukprot:GHRQ01038552.1.p1 GENE.GHRQ01038552.1~~GHRQ01038552.1.p1  ORF type:complete len:181 (+),score=14.29 GHRQ01038552.1:767-1309(+)